MFLFVINIIKRKKQVERIIVLITLLAVILSFYAIIWHYFILEKTMTGSFGTFGNRNHFAAYIGMIAPLVIGYSLSCRNRFKRFFFGFLGAFLSASVFLSLSRAGSISLGVALLLMIFFLKKDWFKEGKIWLIGSVILIAVILVILAGTDLIFERFSYFWENLDKRLSLFRDSLGIVKDFPLFGVGLGNFQYIFTAYRTAPAYNYYYYLHNDYMQLIVEAGLLGAFFYFLFLFQTFKKIITKLRKRHDLFVKNIVIGGGCGLIGTLIHSFFDFNFHIPAVFIMFYIILGIIYKIVNIHFYSKPMAKNNDNQKN
ncbi:MAG: O-antigen ligase family protein [Candidatus Omnitrophica bacterium]|nr:O-antigen ligase family protein [Candidatus Omnitrophota bacterium]